MGKRGGEEKDSLRGKTEWDGEMDTEGSFPWDLLLERLWGRGTDSPSSC